MSTGQQRVYFFLSSHNQWICVYKYEKFKHTPEWVGSSLWTRQSGIISLTTHFSGRVNMCALTSYAYYQFPPTSKLHWKEKHYKANLRIFTGIGDKYFTTSSNHRLRECVRWVKVTVNLRGCLPGNLSYARCFRGNPRKLYSSVLPSF